MTVRVSFLFDRPIPFSVISHLYEKQYAITPTQERLPNKKWELTLLCKDYRVPSIVDHVKEQEGYLSTIV